MPTDPNTGLLKSLLEAVVRVEGKIDSMSATVDQLAVGQAILVEALADDEPEPIELDLDGSPLPAERTPGTSLDNDGK